MPIVSTVRKVVIKMARNRVVLLVRVVLLKRLLTETDIWRVQVGGFGRT